MVDEDEVDESNGNRTNLSNPFVSTRFTGVGSLTFGGATKGGGNTKKGVKAARSFDYLISAAKKAFNHLRHAFTQTSIFQHFDLEQNIRIEIDVSDYAIVGVLS